MNFWSQFWPQLIATIIGIAIGIPVALLINSFIESRTEKERKEKILRLIFEELDENLSYLTLVKSDNFFITLRSFSLRIESWRAFSEGGEIEWIKDPELLSRISQAYFHIRSLQNLSDKVFQLTIFDARHFSSREVNAIKDLLEET